MAEEASLRAAFRKHGQEADDAAAPLTPTYQDLVSVRKALTAIEAQDKTQSSNHTIEDLELYKLKLDAIDKRRGAGGVFAWGGAQDSSEPPAVGAAVEIPEGQAVCAEELAEAYKQLERLTETAAPMPTPIKAIYDSLVGLKRSLSLKVQRVSAGVSPYERARNPAAEDADTPDGSGIKRAQGQLDKIDSDRLAHGGVFGGSLESGDIPPGQAVVSELLADCYALVDAYNNAVV